MTNACPHPLAASTSDNPPSYQGPPASGVPLDTGIRLRPRVLIVDPHDAPREMYAWCLRAAGWVVREAASGVDALAIAPSFRPWVVVLELHLPDLEGSELTRRLKDDERTRDILIVAYADEGTNDEEAAKVAWCDEFLPKSCAPETLRTLLDGLVVG